VQHGSRTLLTEIDVPTPDGALRYGKIYSPFELCIPRTTPSMIVTGDQPPGVSRFRFQNGCHVAGVENRHSPSEEDTRCA